MTLTYFLVSFIASNQIKQLAVLLFCLWLGLFSLDQTPGEIWRLTDAIGNSFRFSMWFDEPHNPASVCLASAKYGCIWKLNMTWIKFPLSATRPFTAFFF